MDAQKEQEKVSAQVAWMRGDGRAELTRRQDPGIVVRVPSSRVPGAGPRKNNDSAGRSGKICRGPSRRDRWRTEAQTVRQRELEGIRVNGMEGVVKAACIELRQC